MVHAAPDEAWFTGFHNPCAKNYIGPIFHIIALTYASDIVSQRASLRAKSNVTINDIRRTASSPRMAKPSS